MPNANTAAVVHFLNSHDIVGALGLPTVALVGEELVVRSVSSDKDGITSIELETIKPTMRAARDWLGY